MQPAPLTVCSDDRRNIDEKVRKAAYHIIQGKGATYYGIGSAIARITEVILRDQRAILTVCTPLPDVDGVSDVTVSLPHLVGGAGIISTIYPTLDPVEQAALHTSTQLIKNILVSLDMETSS